MKVIYTMMDINDKYLKKLQILYKEHKILVDDLSSEELNSLIELFTKQNLALEKKLNSKK